MRVLPRSPYVLAILGAAALVAVAWGSRGRYQMVGPGTEAPEFTATTLAGDTAHLGDYRGRIVLLNIWATWCSPCREEMPSMERLYQRLRERGVPFEVVAVSIDARAGEKDASGKVGGDLAAFVEEFGLTFTVLHDPTGRIQRTYQTTGVPESFLIAREGTIYRRLVGAVEWDTAEWERTIERLAETGS